MSAPPDPIFFTDRDLGKQFAAILRKAGVAIEMHSQHFADDTRDEVWLKAIGERKCEDLGFLQIKLFARR